MTVPPKTMISIVILSLFWLSPAMARKGVLSVEEQMLLMQDGNVDLHDTPSRRVLKKTWFWAEAESSQRVEASSAGGTVQTSKKVAIKPQIKKKKKRHTRSQNERDARGAALLAKRIIKGDTQRAVKESLDLRRGHPEVALRLSRRLWAQWLHPLLFAGEDKQASDFLKVLLALDPEDAQAHEALGTMEWRAGKDGEALKHYKRALQLNPDKQYLRQRLLRRGVSLP